MMPYGLSVAFGLRSSRAGLPGSSNKRAQLPLGPSSFIPADRLAEGDRHRRTTVQRFAHAVARGACQIVFAAGLSGD